MNEEKQETEEVVEEVQIHKLKTVSGDDHKHIWINDWNDDEGKSHWQCTKCFAGIYRPIKKGK